MRDFRLTDVHGRVCERDLCLKFLSSSDGSLLAALRFGNCDGKRLVILYDSHPPSFILLSLSLVGVLRNRFRPRSFTHPLKQMFCLSRT